MSNTRKINTKSQNEIAKEWDMLAEIREKQINKGLDISYNNVLLPCINELINNADFTNVIDIGCGVGVLTKKLSEKCNKITGIDLSRKSIEIAETSCKTKQNVSFYPTPMEEFSKQQINDKFTLAIANMVLMDVVDLNAVIESISKILRPNAMLIVTLTHPCFWPIYWNYFNESWFEYQKESVIESDFKISLENNNLPVTTHIHRPIELYFDTLRKYNFFIDKLVEPMPDQLTKNKYPQNFNYPRFLGLKCIYNKELY